ncbi:Peptidase S10, serine carboxypeptidase [Cynara cardunculus var. scolymus]|uniref:Peptidase S10, serine carboxypeptidase n=1 Tax=Cynara cardunculus var. scolymus TaxID=59895 RepID=A0A103XUY1_CYNCS|nr:Peptidase S10, serine carboxypeptidase [Cynara cardunculus var. scolymus]
MEYFGSKSLTCLLLLLLTLESELFIAPVLSKSIVSTLPGYPGELPFKLETGYVGIGEKEDAQFFYYFVESEGNPEEDPLIFYLTGGPGCSAVITFFYQIGPLTFNFDHAPENLTIERNPNSWTKMANVIFVDMPAGTGFSYATSKEGWISSDSIIVKQATDFLRKFLIDHPKFLNNPLYISAISYMGIVTPSITLELYNANERGDQPALNIQGYILCSPLTDKFMDFNSRIEYAHRMALISDDIYKSATENCRGNYVNADGANSICKNSLDRYQEEYYYDFAVDWANEEAVQQALNIRPGTIGKWEFYNTTMHYREDKNDTFCYAYDMFSSFAYHKKLVSKNCRALIFSGDHDMTFPYVGIEDWISALNLGIDRPWKPFYVDGQVGGYDMTYAQNDYSLTFATVKGAGHSVAQYKPREAYVLTERWLASKSYSSAI